MSQKILIPLDGSRMGEAAVTYVEDMVSKLAAGQKVAVTLLHVVSTTVQMVVAEAATVSIPYTDADLKQIKKKATDYLTGAGAGLRKKGAKVKAKVVVGRAAEEIIKVEDEIKADLVAMSTHGRSGISRWAFGSVTDKVLRGGTVPVLMVRAHD